jgi:Protein of unknown function (DUF2462)
VTLRDASANPNDQSKRRHTDGTEPFLHEMVQGETKNLQRKPAPRAQQKKPAPKKGQRAIPPKKAAAIKQATLQKVCTGFYMQI